MSYRPSRSAASTSLGTLLRAARVRQRRTLTDVAAEADLDHSYVLRLESGQRHPSRVALEQLLRVLRLPRSDHERILWTAGFVPWAIDDIGDQGFDLVHSLGRLLTNHRIAEERKLALCATIREVLGVGK